MPRDINHYMNRHGLTEEEATLYNKVKTTLKPSNMFGSGLGDVTKENIRKMIKEGKITNETTNDKELLRVMATHQLTKDQATLYNEVKNELNSSHERKTAIKHIKSKLYSNSGDLVGSIKGDESDYDGGRRKSSKRRRSSRQSQPSKARRRRSSKRRRSSTRRRRR